MRILNTATGISLALIIGIVTPIQSVSAATYFYHTDHLGTPQVLTDASQNTVWQGEQEPFGTVIEQSSTVEQNLRFPGQYYDRESEFYYNYYRTYDPALSRYHQSDPVGLFGGLSTYGYVNNNPIGFFDPLGLFEIRSYPLKTKDGLVDQFEFEFHPVSKNATEIATKIGRYSRRFEMLIDLIDVKPVGPNRPYVDYLQCGLLDAELKRDFQNSFPDGGRISREQAEMFLENSTKKYPQMSDLYDTPENLLDLSVRYGRNNKLNRIIFQGY